MKAFPSVVDQAADYARLAHEGQVRAGGEPYINHCERVAGMVALLCEDQNVIAAAWLHDVIEDTDATAEDVRGFFGPTVATLVVELTDVYTPSEGMNRATRKMAEARRMGSCSWAARLIKLCDVIDNARDIEAKGGAFAEVWRAEKALLVRELMR